MKIKCNSNDKILSRFLGSKATNFAARIKPKLLKLAEKMKPKEELIVSVKSTAPEVYLRVRRETSALVILGLSDPSTIRYSFDLDTWSAPDCRQFFLAL